MKMLCLALAMSSIVCGCAWSEKFEQNKANSAPLYIYSEFSTDTDVIERVEIASLRKEYIETVFLDYYAFNRSNILQGKVILGNPIAGIVNHHSLAMDLQTRFFKSLKMSKPNIDVFIIVSPDHFLSGEAVSTHDYGYLTYHGLVKSRVLSDDRIHQANSNKVFANEHGVGSLAPFIAREFPDAEIAPIFIRPEATSVQLYDLAKAINESRHENAFIIISSDMSHYLDDAKARKNDTVTTDWLKNNNWDKLGSADDDYTDSSQAFVVMKGLFSLIGVDPEFMLLDYAVSTDYGGDATDTTSYITGFYIE